ncbi:MAG: hypothetical protein IPM54_42875 [Polyangiaceae bacterium]|nr:hypothetical protein [Polyangiaceae bacterium]
MKVAPFVLLLVSASMLVGCPEEKAATPTPDKSKAAEPAPSAAPAAAPAKAEEKKDEGGW